DRYRQEFRPALREGSGARIFLRLPWHLQRWQKAQAATDHNLAADQAQHMARQGSSQQNSRAAENSSYCAAISRFRLSGMAASRLNAEWNNDDFSSRRLQMSTSSLRAKWKKGGDCGRVIPAAEAILLISISASASCNGHCRWWISAQYTLP